MVPGTWMCLRKRKYLSWLWILKKIFAKFEYSDKYKNYEKFDLVREFTR